MAMHLLQVKHPTVSGTMLFIRYSLQFALYTMKLYSKLLYLGNKFCAVGMTVKLFGFILLSQVQSVYLFRHFYTANICEQDVLTRDTKTVMDRSI